MACSGGWGSPGCRGAPVSHSGLDIPQREQRKLAAHSLLSDGPFQRSLMVFAVEKEAALLHGGRLLRALRRKP